MNSRDISWGEKVAGSYNLQHYHIHMPIDRHEIWESQPHVNLGACKGIVAFTCLYIETL
jgi:hypothetical protein